MDRLEELTMAALRFREADIRYDKALEEFVAEVDAKKSDLTLSLACRLAEAGEAWDKAERRLKKAAKRVRVYF